MTLDRNTLEAAAKVLAELVKLSEDYDPSPEGNLLRPSEAVVDFMHGDDVRAILIRALAQQAGGGPVHCPCHSAAERVIGEIVSACTSHVDGRDLLAELKLPQSHMIDIKVRRDGADHWYEGDWLKRLFYSVKKARDGKSRMFAHDLPAPPTPTNTAAGSGISFGGNCVPLNEITTSGGGAGCLQSAVPEQVAAPLALPDAPYVHEFEHRNINSLHTLKYVYKSDYDAIRAYAEQEHERAERANTVFLAYAENGEGVMVDTREKHTMQLVAISTAALQNTRQSEPPFSKEHPYWTPAYQDVLDAVGREIEWRERAERAERELDEARAKLNAINESVLRFCIRPVWKHPGTSKTGTMRYQCGMCDAESDVRDDMIHKSTCPFTIAAAQGGKEVTP